MLRTALRPRFLVLLVLALLAASLCAWAGNWQWRRAHDKAPSASSVADRPTRPLASVLAPQTGLTGQALASPVRTTGRFDTRDPVFVRHRLGDRDGVWVVVPLRVSGTTGAARLPVVLGWSPASTPKPQIPSGQVSVEGVLQQPDEPGADPQGRVYDVLSTAQLVNRWGPPMYTAYLLDEQASAGLTPVPIPEPRRNGLALQNFSYAIQWFLFAGFAVFLWWRVVRDAHEDEQEAADEELSVAS